MAVADILRAALKSKKSKPAALGALGLLGASVPAVGKLITDELLGFDDFRRVGKYAESGEFGKMLKSLGAGVFELGSTVVPGGAILKGAKAGKLVSRSSPIGGRVLSMIPGMTADAGLNAGGRFLTDAGRRSLQGFRVAEAGQIADALNSGAFQFGMPSAPIGSAAMAADRLARETETERIRQALLAMLAGGNQNAF
jgi:hypothetical protein